MVTLKHFILFELLVLDRNTWNHLKLWINCEYYIRILYILLQYANKLLHAEMEIHERKIRGNHENIVDYNCFVSRVFTNGLGDLGLIPGRIIPKTLKWYLMPPCSIMYASRVK